VIDVTAQSSASAAAAVKALRKDLKAAEGDPHLLEALARLGEEIDRLEQKIPARIALRLPDSQLAAIAQAVRGPAETQNRTRAAGKKPTSTAKRLGPTKAAPGAGRAATSAERTRAPSPPLPVRRPPATDPGVRSW
jgi:hypothetical protein